MKTVVTFEKNEMTKVQRIDDRERVIGERYIAYEDFTRSIMKQVPVAVVISQLIFERENCIDEYFEDLQVISNQIEHTRFLLKLYEYINEMMSVENLERFKRHPDILLEIIPHIFCNQSPVVMDKIIETIMKNAENPETSQRYAEFIKNGFQYLSIGEKMNLVKQVTVQKCFIPIKHKADFIAEKANCMVCFYDIAKSQFRVKYYDISFNAVGHPRLLFAVEVDKESSKIQKVYCAALKGDDTLNMDSQLFRYPYSNVYDDGVICWSDFSMLTPDQVPTSFLSSVNNGHLNNNVRLLFEQQENQEFDDGTLVPLHRTIGDWC